MMQHATNGAAPRRNKLQEHQILLPFATPEQSEATQRLREYARSLMKLFFVDGKGKGLVGRLTKLPAEDNEAAVCQWLIQFQHELAWRDFHGREFRGVVQAFRHRLASLPALPTLYT